MRSGHRIAFALLYTFIASSPVIAASPIGNTVQASTKVSASGRTLQRSSPVYFNDVLRSNATGLGQFVFDDGTKLAMGPSATVTIDQSIYTGDLTAVTRNRGPSFGSEHRALIVTYALAG